MSPPAEERSDVLVVGAGPAGSAAAIVLSERGHRVTLVDRASSPGPGACGGLLTPRALTELDLLEIDRPAGHRISSISLMSDGRSIERPWPDHPGLPVEGLAVDRAVLGAALLERARSAGATVRTGYTATDPIVERGFLRGAELIDADGRPTTVRARYLVAADGATSRFGRSIGTFRRKDWPVVAAIGASWTIDRSDPSVMRPPAHRSEVHLGLRGRDDSFIAGLGWVLPTGEQSVRVSIGLWSTSREFGTINVNELLASFAAEVAERWGLDPSSPRSPADGARIPVGGSVLPVAGPAHLIAGDAGGAANPLIAAGIETALWSGRLAGEVLAEALDSGDPTTLQRYPSMIASTTGGYYKVGRLATRLAGHPTTARATARAVTRHPDLADSVLRIGLQHLRGRGGPETLYRLARAVTRFGPAT